MWKKPKEQERVISMRQGLGLVVMIEGSPTQSLEIESRGYSSTMLQGKPMEENIMQVLEGDHVPRRLRGYARRSLAQELRLFCAFH